MNFATARLLEDLFMPPAGGFILVLIGLLLLRWRIGRRLVFIALVLLYAACLPVLADTLMKGLDRTDAISPETLTAQKVDAILVLGGGYYGEAAEYGEATVGPYFLERLRYAAWLYRRTGIPAIVSSGQSDAHTGAQLLVEEFGAPVIAVEDRSWTTQDNARNSIALLAERGIGTIALVTHGWHMPRALYSFGIAQEDLTVIAAPMGLAESEPDPADWEQWLPSARALVRMRIALHEYIGLLWYKYQAGQESLLDSVGL